jgi:hypothetical protein
VLSLPFWQATEVIAIGDDAIEAAGIGRSERNRPLPGPVELDGPTHIESEDRLARVYTQWL